MICRHCNNPVGVEGSKYCSECGASTADANVQKRRRGNQIALVLIVTSTMGIAFVLIHNSVPRPTQVQQSPTVSEMPATRKETMQPEAPKDSSGQIPLVNSGDLLHPYDSLKNPFRDKGRMVTFDGLAFPILANARFAEYQSFDPGIAAQSGIKGLRFNRMLSENVCLYDVMGVEMPESRDTQVIGQLAVVIQLGSTPPEEARLWNAEPLGTFDGTNGFGAPIQTPAVRFWSYAEASAGKKVPALSGDRLTAIDLVRVNIKPTGALLALHPDLEHVEWDAVNNEQVCHGCWYVSAHIRKNADSTDPVQYYENPSWEANIVQHTVKPGADAEKLYTTVENSAP